MVAQITFDSVPVFCISPQKGETVNSYSTLNSDFVQVELRSILLKDKSAPKVAEDDFKIWHMGLCGLCDNF